MAEFKRIDFVGNRDYASVSLDSIKEDLTARHKDALRAVRELKASSKEAKAKGGDIKRQAIVLGVLEQYVSLFEGFASDFARIVDDINRGVLPRDLEILKQITKKAAVEEELGRHTFDSLFELVVADKAYGLLWDQINSCILDTLFTYKDLAGLIRRLKVFVTPLAKKVDYARAITPRPKYKGEHLEIPPGTAWKDIWLNMRENEQEVQITAGGKNIGVKDFVALGFVDEKTVKGEPKQTRLWSLLIELANAEGELRFSGFPDQKRKDKLKADVSDLSEAMKQMFHLDEPPFHHYRKFHSYRPKFLISKQAKAIGPTDTESECQTDLLKENIRKISASGKRIQASNAIEARNRGLKRVKKDRS
jgi:hypothetical protein